MTFSSSYVALSPAARARSVLDKTYSDSVVWSLEQLDLDAQDGTVCLSFLNAHAVTMAYQRQDFHDALKSSAWLLRDGIGVKIALRALGYGPTDNLNGTDLIPQILDRYKDRTVAIFGASMEALSSCRDKLAARGITRVIALEHGFHDPDYYIERCKALRPDILVLCMGMPKQELIAERLSADGSCKLLICGGGWADFFSETKKRAPLWVRKLSMEWLFRLLNEPRRLGKRYTFGIAYFFYVLLRAVLGAKAL